MFLNCARSSSVINQSLKPSYGHGWRAIASQFNGIRPNAFSKTFHTSASLLAAKVNVWDPSKCVIEIKKIDHRKIENDEGAIYDEQPIIRKPITEEELQAGKPKRVRRKKYFGSDEEESKTPAQEEEKTVEEITEVVPQKPKFSSAARKEVEEKEKLKAKKEEEAQAEPKEKKKKLSKKAELESRNIREMLAPEDGDTRPHTVLIDGYQLFFKTHFAHRHIQRGAVLGFTKLLIKVLEDVKDVNFLGMTFRLKFQSF